MSTPYADLHLHSNYSDGSDSPEEVVARAADLGIRVMALTDHDTVRGVPRAKQAAAEKGIECLNGTEISATFAGREVHILGLGVDIEDEAFVRVLDQQVQERDLRARDIVRRLNELGVAIEYDNVKARVKDGAVGRMHIAQELLALGHVGKLQGAFDKYLKAGRKAFVLRDTISAEQAVELIHDAGGLAFIAHPGIGDLRKRLDRLLTLPFDGIEVFHSRHSSGQVDQFRELAQSRGLLMSGGSDCHGTVKGEKPLMGTVRLHQRHYEPILEALSRVL